MLIDSKYVPPPVSVKQTIAPLVATMLTNRGWHC